GHKWADVSEGGYGVAVLNDCKYGHSAHEGEIDLTLIKSGIEPNATTDQEEHFFTYSLYPHAGTWRESDVPQEAYKLNQPSYAANGGKEGESFSFASTDHDNVVLETVKKAENGKGIIFRVYENRNMRTNAAITFGRKLKNVSECDLLENVTEKIACAEDHFEFNIKPYEIKTFLVEF
ncbi:MAG TPA: glycosyl hydrolase-related protein, partial [Oscillospiraceae bacterium]|nr:glycosyl hydrolase-related protein [Oscillospiraceae bacterium]